MKHIKSMLLGIFLLATTCITQASLGGKTLGPQPFTVAQPFNKPGLVGNYFITTQSATIHDPTGKNPTNYTFKDIIPYNRTVRPPLELTYIGSFPTPNWESSGAMGGISQTTSLYGKLAPKESN